MVLERYRVDDDYDSGRGGVTKEYTVDCPVRVFESMDDDFCIGEVLELKACHCVDNAWRVRPGVITAGTPGRDMDAVRLYGILGVIRHFVVLLLVFLGFAFSTLVFPVSEPPTSEITSYLCSFPTDALSRSILGTAIMAFSGLTGQQTYTGRRGKRSPREGALFSQ